MFYCIVLVQLSLLSTTLENTSFSFQHVTCSYNVFSTLVSLLSSYYPASITVDTFSSVNNFDTERNLLLIEKLHRKARAANRFGVAALVSLFVPIVNLISLLLAVIAIIKGRAVKKKLPENDAERRTANKGIIAGIIAIELLGLAAYILVRLYKMFGF